MKKISVIILVFVFGLLSATQNVFAQENQSDSELGIFLKTKGYTPIQLKKFATGHLYLTAQINDSTAIFVLDTGAGSTVIDKKNESKYKLDTTASNSKAVGAGGSNMPLKESFIQSLNIQDYILNNLKIHLMSLDHINNAFKQVGMKEVDGVIGADILDKGKAIIDYTNLILYLK